MRAFKYFYRNGFKGSPKGRQGYCRRRRRAAPCRDRVSVIDQDKNTTMANKPRSYKPVSGFVLPRFAGIATFMRLPHVPLEDLAEVGDVDIGLIGVPWDGGTTNRAGARHGPRQIRDLSTLLRNVHHVSGTAPFELANCADIGDTPSNPIDLHESIDLIEKFYAAVHKAGVLPLSAGGDHLITLPIMRAIAKDRPVGMVHFDAHTDTNDRYFGGHTLTHGTPFRRAIEEGLLDPKRTVQIGIRGSLYTAKDMDWGREQGIRVITIEEYFALGVDAVIAEARRVVGDGPTYLSFDVDGLDPVYAPGTGTPEIGGYSTHEAQRMIRGLAGVNLVGADVVEVSPPFDPSGTTALVGATLMYEILCLLAEIVAKR
ncbi:MAG: agmatinase [Kiloniellaceae bacterium]